MVTVPLVLLRVRRFADAPGRVLTLGLLLTGVGLVLSGVSPGVAALLAFYFLAGAGNGLENVACDTIIGRTVEPSRLGRVFGAVYGPIFLASTLAAGVGGLLVSLTSPRTTFLIAGGDVLLIMLLVRALLPRSLDAPDGHP